MSTTTKPYDSTPQAALLLLPTAAVLVAFLYCPALETFRFGLYEVLSLGQRQTWTGLGDFATLLTSGTYQYSFFITAVLTTVVVFGTLGILPLIGCLIFSVNIRSSVYLATAI